MLFYLAALLGLGFLYQWYRERQTVENLTEKYVFITGCDTGFGNLLARQLDSKGMKVLAGCLTQKGAEDLKKVTSNRLKTTILDVTDTENVAAAAKWVKECVGDKGLWGLVNNAGIGLPLGRNDFLTKDDFAKVINVNLLGLIDVTLQMLPLVKSARGRVVNMSSVLGRIACFGGGYCPAKYGVEAFSDSLRTELRPFGVHVIIMEPGSFQTAVINIDLHLKSVWARQPPDIKKAFGEEFINSYCKISNLVLKLRSKKLSWVTNNIEHALKSCYPRKRYSAGWDAKCFFLPASYMPSCVFDFFVSCVYPKPAQAT